MLSFNANPPQETFVIQFPPHIKYRFFHRWFHCGRWQGKFITYFFSAARLESRRKEQIQRETRRKFNAICEADKKYIKQIKILK